MDTSSSENVKLNPHDQQVLSRIFSPDDPNLFQTIDLELPLDDDFTKTLNLKDKEALTNLQLEAIKLAEEGRLEEALKAFDFIVVKFPKFTAAWNDRAQVKVLMQREREAAQDLETAMTLNGPETRCEAIKQVYSQYGLLMLAAGEQEKALESFKKAASMGDAFAKKQLVQLNPYAALCNKYIGDLLKKAMQGDQ
ncbi:Tetratricopeptide repeat protein 36 [Cichlidogyrus casuarinus]|uniref:Tetratricopeptide repeat protein 36 n=1 Tax=Cichlidogyrus casuarinus TaxID=1844966 RepID=A0ABD2QPV5_9PLAT